MSGYVLPHQLQGEQHDKGGCVEPFLTGLSHFPTWILLKLFLPVYSCFKMRKSLGQPWAGRSRGATLTAGP